MIEQARLVDTNVDGVVIKGKGHWLMEEAPSEVIPRLVTFINKYLGSTLTITATPVTHVFLWKVNRF